MALILASSVGAIDTALNLSFWPPAHLWPDLISIPSVDDGFDVRITSTQSGSCKLDEIFTMCDSQLVFKYRYITIEPMDSSKRFQYLPDISVGFAPESPFGAVEMDSLGKSWTEHYKIRDRVYFMLELSRDSTQSNWFETGDTIYLKWSFVDKVTFDLQARRIRQTVGISSKDKPISDGRFSRSMSLKILGDKLRLFPRAYAEYDFLGRQH